MYTSYLLLNKLKSVDVAFFLICLGIAAAAVAIYFLIPIFNKSQYEERRNNLRKREAAFKHGRTDYNANGTMIYRPEDGEEVQREATQGCCPTTDEAAQDVSVSEVTERAED